MRLRRRPRSTSRRARAGLAVALAFGAAACAGPRLPRPLAEGEQAVAGVVFDDRDADGRRGVREPGIAGVAVSNGRDVVRSDARGRFRLPAAPGASVFVIKPRGHRLPLAPDGRPRFHRVVSAQEPPEAPLELPLHASPEPEAFRAVLLADPQPYDATELGFLARDVVDELVGIDAAFGLVLGDLVGDDVSLFEPLAALLGRVAIPWHAAIGNHDLDFAAADDAGSRASFERAFGPATHAFQVGRAHFLVLDDVIYAGAGPDGRPGGYRGGLAEAELAFASAYLATVPEDDLVVVAMHIPLVGPGIHQVPERRELLARLARFPHTLSLSGHSHLHAHRLLGAADGFERDEPHDDVTIAAASGSWWRGEPGADGIPHAQMRDGAPNGYALLEVDGSAWRLRFKAARQPAEHQLAVHVADPIEPRTPGGAEIAVNVFAGSPRTRVELRVDGGAWSALSRVPRRDPGYEARYEAERRARPPHGWGLPPPVDSPHLWIGRLPEALAPGEHRLEVRAEDPRGVSSLVERRLRVR